jgi:HipA-like protein
MQFTKDPNQLEVYSEIRKSKTFVGTLKYDSKQKKYIFDYDRKYIISKSAIPVGPELPLSKLHHIAKGGDVFPSLLDRIPEKENAAYEDYCLAQGIFPKEKNPIVLLSTIGRRGPSTFVFEPVYLGPDIAQHLKDFRKALSLSLREVSAAFDVNLLTLYKIEKGKSKDKGTLRLLTIYFTFPKVALWQLNLSRRKLHKDLLSKLTCHFENIK